MNLFFFGHKLDAVAFVASLQEGAKSVDFNIDKARVLEHVVNFFYCINILALAFIVTGVSAILLFYKEGEVIVHTSGFEVRRIFPHAVDIVQVIDIGIVLD